MKKLFKMSLTAWIWGMCVVIISAPFWSHTLPPLTDALGHIGRFTIQTERENATILREWYDFSWAFVPNLGVDLIIEIFAPWFGVETTTKAVTILIPTLNLIGLLLVSREAHGRVSPLIIFVFPVIYHYPLHFGFLNYSLSIGLAFILLAFWMYLTRANRNKLKLTLFVGLSVLIWICHLYGWAVMIILIGAFEITRRLKHYGISVRALTVTSLSCLVLLTPLIFKFMFPVELSGPAPTDGWFDGSRKAGWLIMTVRDRWLVWDVFYAVSIIGLILFTLNSRKFEKNSELVVAGILFALLYLIIPYELLGSKFADMRLVPVILMVFLLSVKVSDRASVGIKKVIIVSGLGFFVLRLAGNIVSLNLYAQHLNAELQMLESIPVGANLVTLVPKDCPKDAKWNRHRVSHIGSIALSRKNAFSNDQWSTSGAHLVRVIRQDSNYFTKDPSQKFYLTECRSPNINSLQEALDSGGFDYLWIVSAKAVSPVSPNWVEIDKVRDSRLYRFVHTP